ncbi:MAG: sialidase family protein [Opitutus sp.]
MNKLPLRLSSVLLFSSVFGSAVFGASATPSLGSGYHARNTPEVLLADPRVHVSFGDEKLVIEDGLQPSMVITRTGAIIVQSQTSKKSFPGGRYASRWAMGTVISRDDGATWTDLPLKPNEIGLNLEGGGVQLRDGAVIALDTYVVPGSKPGEGLGQLYVSKDDWRTVEGPIDVTFNLPQVNFSGSSDDGGRPHTAIRLHRRILELPNGDLLTTLYGWFEGDTEPSAYMKTMRKTRTMLVRSTNHGRHWDLVSTIAVDPKVGTEGYDEPVIARIAKGPHAGRLICQMRTGQEQRETFSDDNGRTWAPAYPRIYAGLDVYRTENWAEMFKGVKNKHGVVIENDPTEFIGAVVDPDLLELRSGVLVASFGVRVPPRSCWPHAEHPWNGNYLAVSIDHGATWSHVVRMTSGVLTTHYTAMEETMKDNRIFFAHDLGDWGTGRGRSTHGRFVQITVDPK